ncbi:MAG: group 1 glycosyl transferase [Microcoleaceae cyanobacterium]
MVDLPNMPNINYLESSGWINSLKIDKPVNADGQPVPWYSYPAIEFIEDKLHKNLSVFEYGAGQSTLWYSQRVRQVISVESDQGYFQTIHNNLPSNVKIFLHTDATEYAEKILQFPDQSFDVIVIDGINRVKCAELADQKLKNTGFIVFDNSDRVGNDAALILLHDQDLQRIDFYGLTPTQRYKTCTSIFFHDHNFLRQPSLPSQKQSCLGVSLGQYEELLARQHKPENMVNWTAEKSSNVTFI